MPGKKQEGVSFRMKRNVAELSLQPIPEQSETQKFIGISILARPE